MKRRTDYSIGSGNVFKDLGVASPEETLVKAELTAKITEIISTMGITQAAAAKLLGVDEPKVSALLRGRLSGFSTERPLRFVTALGRDVRIVIGAESKSHRPGHLDVVSARG